MQAPGSSCWRDRDDRRVLSHSCPAHGSAAGGPAVGWGIIGPGRIASAFAESLAAHTRQRIVAVGSRSIETASNFAKRFDGCDAVKSYEELVKHPAVDIVNVSTPHSFHHQMLFRSILKRDGRNALILHLAVPQAIQKVPQQHNMAYFVLATSWHIVAAASKIILQGQLETRGRVPNTQWQTR
jgi:glutamyl-tRNA reductase